MQKIRAENNAGIVKGLFLLEKMQFYQPPLDSGKRKMEIERKSIRSQIAFTCCLAKLYVSSDMENLPKNLEYAP